MVRLTLDMPARFLAADDVGVACWVVWLLGVDCWGGEEVPLVLSGELLLITPVSGMDMGINMGFIVLSTFNIEITNIVGVIYLCPSSKLKAILVAILVLKIFVVNFNYKRNLRYIHFCY